MSDMLTIEPGGLDALDVDRVGEVLAILRDNAYQARRLAGQCGEAAADDKAKGWDASFEQNARVAARYARIAMAYQDAMLWIMSATAVTSYALAVGDTEQVDGDAVSDARSDEPR